jgi:lipid-binding SYLF domain-containing protein
MQSTASVRPALLRALRALSACLGILAIGVGSTGCNTAPKYSNRQSFALEAKAAENWFDENVSGFRDQIRESGGYIVFPDVGEWGIVFVGGTFGRGGVYSADGTQIGWAAINRTGVGLTLGAQGQKVAIVLKDEATMRKFKQGTWSGDVAATVVAAQEGAAASKQFKEGVVIYVGDQAGLMAGVSIALSHVRYKSLADLE